VVSVLDDLLRLPRVLLPDLEHFGVELPNALMSSIGRRIEHAVRHIELEVSITDRDELFYVPGVQRGEGPLDELNGRRYLVHPQARWYRRIL